MRRKKGTVVAKVLDLQNTDLQRSDLSGGVRRDRRDG